MKYVKEMVPLPKALEPERRAVFPWRTYSVVEGTQSSSVGVDGSQRIVPEAKMQEIIAGGVIQKKHAYATKYPAFVHAVRDGKPRQPVDNIVDTASKVMEILLLGQLAMDHGQVGKG